MSWFPRFFPAFLISTLLLVGVAWAQSQPGVLKSKSLEKKTENEFLKPWQPRLNKAIDQSLRKEEKQSSPTGIMDQFGKDNSISPNKKAVGANDTTRIKPQPYSFGSTLGNYGVSNLNSEGSVTFDLGRSLINQGYNQPNSFSSPSFLDGYFLRSLQDKGMAGKNKTKRKDSEDDLLPRGNGSF